MGDIAVYEAGPARCTGGAGAVAILMSREAPLQIEKEIGLCESSPISGLLYSLTVMVIISGMRPTYDFFKPNTYNHGAYPMVDGALSLQTYVTSMKECHERLGRPSLDDYDHVIMHSPFTKLVNKAFARLAEGELVNGEVPWMDKENAQVVSGILVIYANEVGAGRHGQAFDPVRRHVPTVAHVRLAMRQYVHAHATRRTRLRYCARHHDAQTNGEMSPFLVRQRCRRVSLYGQVDRRDGGGIQ